MKDKTKFSIIIPVYNVEQYVEQCIESILMQNYQSWELILIDDGSTDKSGMLCDTFEKKEERIQVIHQENKGSSAARNRGIDLATGEYIMFLDGDDYWKDANVLDKIFHRLKEVKSDVLSFNYVKFQDNIFEKPYFSQKEDMPADLKENDGLSYLVQQNLWIACAWNKAIRRELFSGNHLRFQQGVTSEDIDWCIRLAMEARHFDYINDVIVCYRQRGSSISKNITVERMDMLLHNIDICMELVETDVSKGEILKPYIAYQYGTAIYHLSTLKGNVEYERLLQRVLQKKHMLQWSNNNKLRMISLVNAIGGMKLVMFLLRLRQK